MPLPPRLLWGRTPDTRAVADVRLLPATETAGGSAWARSYLLTDLACPLSAMYSHADVWSAILHLRSYPRTAAHFYQSSEG